MAWVGDSPLHDGDQPHGGLHRQLPGEPRDRPARSPRAGPTAVLAPPRIWENMLTTVQVRAADAHPAQALGLRALPAGRGGGRDPARGRQADPAAAPPGAVRPGRVLRLRPRPRPARTRPGALGVHRRRPAGARNLSLLPRLRGEPQAGLRLHGVDGAHLAPAGRRGQSHHGRPSLPGDRGADRRPRARCSCAARASSRATTRTTRPPARSSTPRGGSTPATPASSIPAVTWSSSTAPRTWGRCRTARRSRPSSSRTSSSTAPTSARRWPLATTGRSWRP